ncbi:MAG: ABC transporter ATP-binding protein [Chloroflexi bacterium]|nr:ABC transporter ATP-binding protein [Chloroflexota bacterium]
MIHVRDLHHSYTHDARYAVGGVTFDVAEGEIFGFLGPNGAGKSTTQKILTGVIPLQRGEATIAGMDVRRRPARMRNLIGVSFEQPNVYMRLTGYENLAFFASLFDVPTEDPMSLLRTVGLEDAAQQRAGTYSKGMQQRLVLARALINRPRILFLDEPVAGLDPASSRHIVNLIREIRQGGVTVFLTTHDMHVADTLCDRVAFINEGRIAAMDSPRALKLAYGQQLAEVEYRTDGSVVREVLSLVDEENARRLNALIMNRQVETIHSQEASLEDIFIRVTGRELA